MSGSGQGNASQFAPSYGQSYGGYGQSYGGGYGGYGSYAQPQQSYSQYNPQSYGAARGGMSNPNQAMGGGNMAALNSVMQPLSARAPMPNDAAAGGNMAQLGGAASPLMQSMARGGVVNPNQTAAGGNMPSENGNVGMPQGNAYAYGQPAWGQQGGMPQYMAAGSQPMQNRAPMPSPAMAGGNMGTTSAGGNKLGQPSFAPLPQSQWTNGGRAQHVDYDAINAAAAQKSGTQQATAQQGGFTPGYVPPVDPGTLPGYGPTTTSTLDPRTMNFLQNWMGGANSVFGPTQAQQTQGYTDWYRNQYGAQAPGGSANYQG